MTICYTSANFAYLANVLALAESVKIHHPDWHFVFLCNDIPRGEVQWKHTCIDEVIFVHQLGIPDFCSWVRRYNVIESCTAVKGRAMRILSRRPLATHVVYLDPDTVIFNPLNEIHDILEGNSFVLTPHLLHPEDNEPYAIWSHEMAALKHGTFNLGFFAASTCADADAIIDWFDHRLLNYAYIDFQAGLFTDQKWANLMPYLFKGVAVLTDPSYNVATWNMTSRPITKHANSWRVGNALLKFYHFSGFGNDFHWAQQELARFSKPDDQVSLLWEFYADRIQYWGELHSAACQWPWFWAGPTGWRAQDQKTIDYSKQLTKHLPSTFFCNLHAVPLE